MKRSSDLLKNLHHTISTCSKKNRKMFEEELEGMSRKLEGMIEEEFASRSVSVNFENHSKALEGISQRVNHLQEMVDKTLSVLTKEASESLGEILKDLKEVEGIKREMVEKSLESVKGLGEVKKRVLKNLKEDKNAIKQSIKRYQWVDL